MTITYNHWEPLMPNQTLSIREDDIPLWDRARRAAEANRMTLSAFVTTALASKLGTDTDTALSVQVGVPPNHYHQEQFNGRWLFAPMDQQMWHDRGGWNVGVAQTARGRLAVWFAHQQGGAELRVYDTLKDMREELDDDVRMTGNNVWTVLDQELRHDKVVWRDI